MLELARRHGENVTAKEIAERQDIPPKFLPQIMVDLGRAGLVKGTRGSGGGVRLALSPSQITIRRIVEAIEGPLAVYYCLEDEAICQRQGGCEVQLVWAYAQSHFLRALGDITLEDLVTGRVFARTRLQSQAITNLDICPVCGEPFENHTGNPVEPAATAPAA